MYPPPRSPANRCQACREGRKWSPERTKLPIRKRMREARQPRPGGRMIVGSGVDVVEIARLARVIERRGGAFERRVFREGELRACGQGRRRARALALCFAAKEAALKAVGTGWGQGVGFRDVELVGDRIVLHGAAAERAGGARPHLALAADRRRALAFVVLEAP